MSWISNSSRTSIITAVCCLVLSFWRRVSIQLSFCAVVVWGWWRRRRARSNSLLRKSLMCLIFLFDWMNESNGRQKISTLKLRTLSLSSTHIDRGERGEVCVRGSLTVCVWMDARAWDISKGKYETSKKGKKAKFNADYPILLWKK